jgi:N-acetyl-D-muramate 6-phosphate phosphatase
MPLDVCRIRGLLFDMDGTLCDTDDLYIHTLTRWLTPCRSLLPNHDPATVARRLIMSLETPGNLLYEWLDRLYVDECIKWLSRIRNKEKSRAPFWIIAGVETMLQTLHHDYHLALVSSRGEKGTRSFLRQFGLDYFSSVITAHSCVKAKPHPKPVLMAAEELGLAPAHCVMIGDTTVDIRAGKAAGCQTIGVLCGFGERPELEQAGADLILDSTTQLTSLFMKDAV